MYYGHSSTSVLEKKSPNDRKKYFGYFIKLHFFFLNTSLVMFLNTESRSSGTSGREESLGSDVLSSYNPEASWSASLLTPLRFPGKKKKMIKK